MSVERNFEPQVVTSLFRRHIVVTRLVTSFVTSLWAVAVAVLYPNGRASSSLHSKSRRARIRRKSIGRLSTASASSVSASRSKLVTLLSHSCIAGARFRGRFRKFSSVVLAHWFVLTFA